VAFPVGYLKKKKNEIAKSDKHKFSWEPPTGTTLRKIIPVSQPSGNSFFPVGFILVEFSCGSTDSNYYPDGFCQLPVGSEPWGKVRFLVVFYQLCIRGM
jgi:hypothetical protein